MYLQKVFIDERCLVFTDQGIKGKENTLSSLGGGIKPALKQMENLAPGGEYYLISANPEKLFLEFCKNYKIIEAAGGLCLNKNKDFLFIYRNNMWDLPKGKLEKNESIQQCAVREVEEECGITHLILQQKLCVTYHTYTVNQKNILKRSHWYQMQYNGNSTLKPQLEEGITALKWVSEIEVEEILSKSYETIKLVFLAFKNKL